MNIKDLLPFYALDALTDEERAFVEQYLAEHPTMRAELDEMSTVVNELPFGIEPLVPSSTVKAGLMQRVSAHPRAQSIQKTQNNATISAQAAPVRQSFWERLGLQSPWPAATALGFALAAIMLLYAFSVRGDLQAVNNEIAGLQRSVTQLEATNSDLQSSIAQLEDENAMLVQTAAEVETLRNNVAALEAASATLTAENTTLALAAEELETLRDNVVALESAGATLTADNATLNIVNDELQRQLEENATLLAIYTSPDLQTAEIASTDDASSAGGLLVVAPNRAVGILNLHGLEVLSAELTYQFWLIGADGPISAGVFETDDNGQAHYIFDVASLEPYQNIGVSIEPAGGSEQPTAENIVLLGEVES